MAASVCFLSLSASAFVFNPFCLGTLGTLYFTSGSSQGLIVSSLVGWIFFTASVASLIASFIISVEYDFSIGLLSFELLGVGLGA